MDPRVAEALWKAIEGHLPPRPPDMHPLGCHRLRIPDRDYFQGILVRLVTGGQPFGAPGAQGGLTGLTEPGCDVP